MNVRVDHIHTSPLAPVLRGEGEKNHGRRMPLKSNVAGTSTIRAGTL